MKKTTTSLTAAFFVFWFTAAFLQAQTDDQEKCARWSTEFFYREFKSSEGSLGGIPASFARIYCRSGDPCNFQAHYNKKLNKCFILVEIQGIAGKPLPNGAVPVHLQYFLYDAYERIPYGVYEAKYDGTGNKTTTNCWVKDKFRVTPFGKLPECKYEHEFLDAINSFMKE
jgi:hypothetical protein